jgi:hypothetical protein
MLNRFMNRLAIFGLATFLSGCMSLKIGFSANDLKHTAQYDLAAPFYANLVVECGPSTVSGVGPMMVGNPRGPFAEENQKEFFFALRRELTLRKLVSVEDSSHKSSIGPKVIVRFDRTKMSGTAHHIELWATVLLTDGSRQQTKALFAESSRSRLNLNSRDGNAVEAAQLLLDQIIPLVADFARSR